MGSLLRERGMSRTRHMLRYQCSGFVQLHAEVETRIKGPILWSEHIPLVFLPDNQAVAYRLAH